MWKLIQQYVADCRTKQCILPDFLIKRVFLFGNNLGDFDSDLDLSDQKDILR